MKSNPLSTHDEQTRRDNAQTPVRWPNQTAVAGSVIVDMIVTEAEYDTDAAIYRDAEYKNPFSAKRLDSALLPTGSEVDVYTDLLPDVLVTGRKFQAKRIGGKYYAIAGGQHIWDQAVTESAFSGTGQVELYAGGPVVDVITDNPMADQTLCDVEFIDERQVFKITAARCPATPTEYA